MNFKPQFLPNWGVLGRLFSRGLLVAGCLLALGTSSLAQSPAMTAKPKDSVADLPQVDFSKMQTVAYSPGPSGDDWGYQIASMQAQLAQQNHELSQLRSQLNSPLAGDKGRLFATYESVLVQPVFSNNVALITEQSEDVYSQVMFPWQIEHSPRVQFGYENDGGKLGWRVRYWQFRHNESLEANEANGLIPTGADAYVSYLVEDGDPTVGLAIFEEGVFQSRLRTDVIDLELQRSVSSPIDVYAGLRYARIDQAYAAETDRGMVVAQNEFRGLGPTVAMRWEHRLPLDRLSVFMTARGSMLFGQKEFSAIDDFLEIEQRLNDIDTRSGDDGVNAMITNAELQLGMRYMPVKWMVLSCAVETQHFGDVGGANPVAVFAGPDGGISTDSPMDDNLGFLGLTVGAELRY